MRLWSLHPSLMDTKGLVALWRESLLAKNVLENKTKGYRNHPQLLRFKILNNPVDAINYYLSEIHKESIKRNYNFDKTKIDWNFKKQKIVVTTGQIEYELQHLKNKISKRSVGHTIDGIKKIHHPIFRIVSGKIESWEIIIKP
ncbi:MAG: pyrimidine dimer DNA glycosylase/endonuclease V [Bacteroidota bacterium]|nr:pyrimidine dimer DNA glycosylase/endonuclease V [Bacteroidota bacterium]